jgi:hypothetical protein
LLHKYTIHNSKAYIYTENVAETLASILTKLSEKGTTINSINIHEANLEDVFMKLTNAKLENGKLIS